VDFAEILIGFVQIAVALLAFTTISVVVVQVSERTTESLLAIRLKFILLFSTQIVVLGILPLVFSQLELEEGQYWRYSTLGSLFFLCVIAYLSFFILLPRVLQDPKQSWTQTIVASLFAISGMGTNTWIIFSQEPSFWYISTLALFLAATLVMVIGVILSFKIFDHGEQQTNDTQ
jgi:hypothetical protein